jgi:type III restriction-modification system ecoPI, modification subunit
MLIENIKANETINPNDKEIEKLKATFPQFFDKKGEFLLEQFKDMLKTSDIALNKEGYELKFLGKSYARYLSSTKTETFLVPHVAENEKVENKDSDNLYIIGDNLDALKHLLGSYAGKIKCIYIDPPYNTGSDGFVYPDKFSFDAKKLAETIGNEEEEAERIINLKGKSSHSAWLTFMYPRLILARELLSDDGVIFISIDDNEQANLKLTCDEVFGEENFIGNFIINTTPNGRDYGHMAKQHEFCLFYSKTTYLTDTNMLPDKAKSFKYKDEKGGFNIHPLYNSNESFHIENRPNLYYPFYLDNSYRNKDGFYEIYLEKKEGLIEVFPPKSQKNSVQFVWRWGKEKSLKNLNSEIVGYRTDEGDYRIVQKMRNDEKLIRSIISGKSYTSRRGTSDAEEVLGGKYFDFPKPIEFLKDLLYVSKSEENIILDFFSGSATTAHAVMKLNAEDGGNRKYILVQIPEKIAEDKPAYKAGYRTIDEIGRGRIKRAAEKIKEETGADIDYGFKTYSLETVEEEVLTNLDVFDDNPRFILDDMVGLFDTKEAKGKEAILSTYLVLDGYGLSEESEVYKLDKYIANKIEKSLYIIESGLQSSDVMELIRRLETMELDITRVVIYVHSIGYQVLHELRRNLKNLRNNKSVELIERY